MLFRSDRFLNVEDLARKAEVGRVRKAQDASGDGLAGAETIDRLFTVDAVEYFVSIFPTDQQAISRLLDEECVASGAGVGCVGFTTEEGQSTSVQIGITISTDRINQVPVPPAFALLSGALVVLAGVRRRSRGCSSCSGPRGLFRTGRCTWSSGPC